jgi:DNA-binding protein H-NS
MAATSPRQRRITGRVMHEFKHGELESGPDGKGGKVRSRRQAIAIALEEAGSSKHESKRRNARNLRRTERKEATGRTAQQEREGKSHVGARRQRESTRAMAGAMPAKPPRGAARQQPRAPANMMVTPGKNSTPRRRHTTSRGARK